MSWQNEMVRTLRYLINDLDSTPTYSQDRLEETILVSAQLVLSDVSFDTAYTVDVDELILSPDPTSGTKDIPFMNLTLLKAGCIIDNGLLRSQVGNVGFRVKVGPDEVDTRDRTKGYELLLKNSLCKEYEKAKFEYEAGNNSPGRSVLGPYSHPNLNSYNSSCFDREYY